MTRSYYRKESAAFLPHELNAKLTCIVQYIYYVYTSRQFSKGKLTFDSMASFPCFVIGSIIGLHIKVISPMYISCTNLLLVDHLT